MKSFSVLVTSIYLISLTLFFNHSSPLVLWVLLEINMLTIIGLFLLWKTQEKNYVSVMADSCFFYFMIQSLGSFLILVSVQFSSSFMVMMSMMIMMIAMFLKMGLFPFQIWVVKLSKSLGDTETTILLTLQKIPLMMVLFSFISAETHPSLALSFVMGAMLINLSNSMKDLMIYSSIYSFFWMFYLFSTSTLWFSYFYLSYMMGVYACISSKLMEPSLNCLASFLFFMGLPPFNLFFIKVGIVEWMYVSLSTMEIMFFWIFTFVALFGYMSKFKYSMVWKNLDNKFSYGFFFIVAMFMMIHF